LIGNPKGKHAEDWVFVELHNLVHGLPLLGRDDPEQGPLIEVPHTLVEYWQRQQPLSPWRPFDFSKMSKVQTLRFVELCEQYGFKEGIGDLNRAQMVPLAAWQAGDQAELQDLLKIATA